jgi:hypothetical protein
MSANLSAVPKLQFFDNNGNPLVGGKLYTYAAGTTTPLATYTDASAGTPNTNPVILDSRGEANVWLSATTYKFVLKDSADATIWTVDNISNSLSLSQILAASGSAASPPYTFASDTDTGMYLAAVGQIGFSVAGVPVLRSNSTAMTIGQSGGANDVDVTHYGDTLQTGNFNLTGDVNVTGAAVFNEAGADKDFRVEGDTDANLLFVDASTDRVGVGTNAPSSKLHVAQGTGSAIFGTTAGGSGYGGVFQNTDAGTTKFFNAAGAGGNGIFSAGLGASTYLFMDTSGNVGIGTNSPVSVLHAKSSNGIIVSETTAARNSNNNYIVFRDATGNAGTVGYTNVSSAFILDNTLNGVMNFATNGAARMQIGADGSQSSVIPSGSTLYPQFACRAWINFNGTGTPASRGNGNVSSITDNGTGDYTINFTTAMPDANYAVVGMAMGTSGVNEAIVTTPGTVAWAAGSVRIGIRGGAGTLYDVAYVNVAVFR